jgi:hypothetical protein
MRPGAIVIAALVLLNVSLALACEVDWLSPGAMIVLLAANPIMLIADHWLRHIRRTAAVG